MARKIVRIDLTAEPPFTDATLRATLISAISNQCAIPDDNGIARLCGILNGWHAQFYRAQEDRELNELVDEATAAYYQLRDLVPKIGERLLRRHNAAGGQDQFVAWALKSALEAQTFVSRPGHPRFLFRQGRPDHKKEWPNPAKDWRWLIEVLPIDIEIALLSSNPGYQPTRSIIAAILAAVIPTMTGDRVTRVSVLNHLAETAKQK